MSPWCKALPSPPAKWFLLPLAFIWETKHTHVGRTNIRPWVTNVSLEVVVVVMVGGVGTDEEGDLHLKPYSVLPSPLQNKAFSQGRSLD